MHAVKTIVAAALLLSSGCALIPQTRTRDVLQNPFPQLQRVAVLPFFNQSESPHVDGVQVARAYFAALQAIDGFEVMPVGVAENAYRRYAAVHGEPTTGAQFQELAREIGAEAIVVGAVTDYDSYYPPRMAMSVNWYAANPGFHAIPSGYGLPWGTEAEENIPARIVRQTEFELARSQLATQTPAVVAPPGTATPAASLPILNQNGEEWIDPALAGSLPPAWPNATDLIPDPPSPVPPPVIVTTEPVLTHTKLHRGDDPYFTGRLSDYVETADDARGMSWRGYVKRSDDFIRFCCHLHVAEMLEARGGSRPANLIVRLPVDRY